MEYEKFYAEIISIGNSKGIIIPHNTIKFTGLKEGEKLKVMIKKITE